MNELTLHQFIDKKIVYLTDRSTDNELLLTILDEYKHLHEQMKHRTHTGLVSLESYLSQCPQDERMTRELQKLHILKQSM